VSAVLRKIASGIDGAKRPSKGAVATAFRRVLVAMNNLVITGEPVLVPDPDLDPADGPDTFPTFRVQGTWKGAPFTYDVSVELGGRDADWEHVDGVDPAGDTDAPDWQEWLGADEEIYNAIYESQAYKDAAEAAGV